jgi:hypothetical protein
MLRVQKTEQFLFTLGFSIKTKSTIDGLFFNCWKYISRNNQYLKEGG